MLWDRTQFRQGHKSPTQNSIQSSRTSNCKGSRKGDAGWSKTSYLLEQTEQVGHRRVLELGTILSKAPGENFVTEGSREPWDGNPGPSGAGAGSAPGRASAPVPSRRGPALGSPLYLGLPGARGRSLRRVSRRPAPGSRRPMSPGRGP